MQLKSIAAETVVICTEIINVANTIPANVTSTVSINSDDKKVRCKMDYYILQAVLLVIMLLFSITFICCHNANRSRQKLFEIITV